MSAPFESKMNFFPLSTFATTLFCVSLLAGCSTLGLDTPEKTAPTEKSQDLPAETTAFAKDDPRFFLTEAAKIAESEGNSLDAMKIYKKILDTHPDYQPAIFGFSRTGRESGQAKVVLAYLYELLSQQDNNSDYVAETAKAHYSLAQYETALKQVDKALETSGGKWEYYSLRGAICDKLSRSDDAALAYEKALDLAPGHPKILNNYAMSRFLVKDLKRAEQYAVQGTQSKQATLQNFQTYATILAKQGRYKEAQDFLETNLNKKQAEIMMRYVKNQTASPVLWGRTNPSS